MRPLRPAVAAFVLVVGTAGCVDTGPETAYCDPQDPVVSPMRVAPGAEVTVEVGGVDEVGGCEPRLPEGARYEIEMRWHGSGTSLGTVRPDEDGAGSGTFTVPADVPAGTAEVSVDLEGARTICEIDPTMSCPKNPFAAVEVIS
ncbi:hypothetical protein FE251_06640 [Georgenia wutianyii]|uniref:Ig-like domain-containing protein n=1 Tax=Georgenia wutianyii TaxID=2585135 RepID=A0ABX5VLL0_9MICO|nr:hypothetical protein [Georgenia wutianyii]QDB79083.1 hypothetical protein FE251_06640 [Georgenia wutianyii]